MIINECSLSDNIEDIHIINEAIDNFISIYKGIKKIDSSHELWMVDGHKLQWNSLTYPLQAWLNKNGKQRDLTRLFLRILTKEIKYFQPDLSIQCQVYNKQCFGAEEAILQDDSLLSFSFHTKWKKETLNVKCIQLDNDEISEEDIPLINIYKPNQINESIIKKVSILDKYKLYDYNQLWNMRQLVYPNLRFCDNIKNDFKQLEKSYINQVIKQLEELNDFAELKPLKFDPSALYNASPESESTLQQYKKEHTFKYEGKSLLVSWHIRFTGYPGRIYFYPLTDAILICHVGRHLPTVRFN